MSPPAVPLRPWRQGPDTTAPVAGEQGFAALVPIAEPISAGEPPVAPDLVERMETAWPVARVALASGQTRSTLTGLCARPRFRLVWTGLEFDERNALLAFLRGEVRGAGLAMTVRIDGPGSEAITVIPVADPVDTWLGRPAWSVEVEVEEVW